MGKILQLKLDFLHGPVWREYLDVTTGEWYTGIDVVDNDGIIAQLDREIQVIYNSCFQFDVDGQACVFADDELKQNKDLLLKLMKKLNNRLDEINDGSFQVNDYITPGLLSLK